MLGRTLLARPSVTVRALEPIPNTSGREHYIRAVVTRNAAGEYEAVSTGEQGSGILTSLTGVYPDRHGQTVSNSYVRTSSTGK